MRALAFVTLFALVGCAGAMTPPPSALPVATAATTSPVADTPIEAVTGVYTLDPRHTSLIWRVRHMNMSLYTARFSKIAGTIDFNAEAPTKSALSATVQTAAVDTGLPAEPGKQSFDAQIAKVLGVDETPQITFVSKSITRTGEKTGTIAGELTMNGVTRPQTLDVTFENFSKSSLLSSKPRLAFSGHAIVKRSDFGATSTVCSLFVGDEVEIIIETEAEKG
jgi:polyisoprenoid-binding protein YceI